MFFIIFSDNTLKSKLTDWAKSKQDFLTTQQECLLEENKQRLKQNEEKHLQEMKHREELHQQKLKMLKEEHAIKMSILNLEKQKSLKELSD